MRVSAALALCAAVLAVPAWSQTPPPADPLGQPAPAVDGRAYWEDPELRVPDRFDPLGGRRWGRNDRALQVDRAPDASLYRLWGLTPLQTQAVRRDETVLEVWVRPTTNRPEVVVRVTIRGDGRVFAQGRAGFACCRPDISRRVDVDLELPRASRDGLLALRATPLWSQPEHVVAQEPGAVSSLCVQGINYDLYLAQNGRGVHRRRSCDDAEVGSAAPVMEALFAAVRGQDARLDAAMPQGGVFAAQRAYYATFTAGGGQLIPAPDAPASDGPPPPPDNAGPTPQQAAIQEIMAADFAWATRTGEVGLGQATGDAMDREAGMVFRRGADPIVGRGPIFQALGGGLPETGRWTWGPVAAHASEEGDFGSSWGRWNFTPTAGGPAQGGRYLTVWRRDEAGQWRGLMTMNDGF